MTTQQAAAAIAAYMTARQYHVDTAPGHLNIVYIEGLNPDFTLNRDEADGWNDLCLLIDHPAPGHTPDVVFRALCTTEPGRAATISAGAAKIGGVARIAFGQYTAWRMGYHRQASQLDTHPALVQCAPLSVHRDKNMDGKRTGDPMGQAYGINQHGTSPHYKGGPVWKWSAGCLVRKWWTEHLDFLARLQTDPRYIDDKKFVFTTTILPGDDFILSTIAAPRSAT